ncbi:MAG: thiamine phosphate synthase [Candidatus Latescibacteria bacterium]|nr:thiamine phosphate synthase [Candidatus Latescibacterota bacterium]
MKRIGALHVLTDTVLQSRHTHAELARMAVAGGADAVQYRQKNGHTREMIETARAMRDICAGSGVPLIVNDRVDVALAAEADGVHLGQDDFPVALARNLLAAGRIIGVSAGNPDEARQGIADGADYVGFGPVFPTGSKSDAGEVQGLEKLADFAIAVRAPVIAIGGIGADNAAGVARSGAHGIAVISAVCCQADPEAATRNLGRLIRDS